MISRAKHIVLRGKNFPLYLRVACFCLF